MDKMTKRKKILLSIVAVVLALLAFGGARAYRFIDYDFESPRLAVFLSPDGQNSAYLLWHGALMGRTVTLFSSGTSSHTDVRWIGSVTADDSLTFGELLWSADSSLVVARCNVGGYCKLPEGTVDQFLLTHGIDLMTDDRFVPRRDVFDATPEDWMTRDGRLRRLLEERGGPRIAVSQNTLHEFTKELTWSEWREWRGLLIKAIEREANN